MPKPTKKCTGPCGKVLPLGDFHKNKSMRDGHAYWCRECRNSHLRERYARLAHVRKNSLRGCKKYRESNPTRERDRRLMNCYGLTSGQHKQLYVGQNGCCALCGDSVPYDEIYTDHDHGTGKVRGLLCRRCNVGLGMLGDTFGSIMRAAEYLKGVE